MKKYIPAQLEQKWQKKWNDEGLYKTDLTNLRKFYVLAEFPYPSGDLHMGHWFTFTGADIYARFKRMQGYNVFFPNGFDAFGLPAENAAIKRGVHPKDWTLSNIERMKEQFATTGGSFTFDHEVITCLPNYYKWNQWIFLKMLEKGLAYRGKYISNWCPNCQTVLANEGVVEGRCWRCDSEVIQKEVEQWFLKIREYADKLIWPDPSASSGLSNGVNWPKSVRDAQNIWIGKSEGVNVQFNVKNSDLKIEVFTTRLDTIYGATFLVLAPEHDLLDKVITDKKKEEVKSYIEKSKKKSELERKENKDKTGVFTGSYAINPFTKEDIPIWIAEYVLSSYGTGAIMAVPAHDVRDFEFAKKHDLSTKTVILGRSAAMTPESNKETDSGQARMTKVFIDYGVLVESGEFSGLTSEEAIKKMTQYAQQKAFGELEVQYHIRDWSISRQRYWGTPIPVIHCKKCGIVAVEENELPVELPYEVDYTPKGKAPLASNEAWVNVKCPKCGGDAKRDADTMDTFIDSSWYFFRYVSPDLETNVFDTDLAKKIMPVDIYFGGAEHTLGHTLYSRFFTKFFKDLGLTDLEEYAQRRINHGIVLGPDGAKMSKSRGNVVNPDEEVKKYGTDAVRVHVAFFMPYDGVGPWISERIWGPYHFLERVWGLIEKVESPAEYSGQLSKSDLFEMNRAIKKVSEDIEEIKFNTAVASLMEWLNYLSRKEKISKIEYGAFLLLLAPFAPHISEELWEMVGEKGSIHIYPWPEVDEQYLRQDEVIVIVQVNGKVRDTLKVGRDSPKEEIEKIALGSSKVQKFLNNSEPKKVIFIPNKLISFVI